MSQSREYRISSLLPVKNGSDPTRSKHETDSTAEGDSKNARSEGPTEIADHDSRGCNIPVEVDFYHIPNILDAEVLSKIQVDGLKQAYISISDRNEKQQQEISKLQKQIRHF